MIKILLENILPVHTLILILRKSFRLDLESNTAYLVKTVKKNRFEAYLRPIIEVRVKNSEYITGYNKQNQINF